MENRLIVAYRHSKLGPTVRVEVPTGLVPLPPLRPLASGGEWRYEWICEGADAVRLGEALLLFALDSPELAASWGAEFASELFPMLPAHGWVLTREEIMDWYTSGLVLAHGETNGTVEEVSS